ncbi:hypothetical protein SAMN06295998_10527 [Primorskyibacter flagellatus]|uniref:Uncharacterized protein n=1 Tax=Primorskyibacter flagellatus TaxID=1387277 RepID=A0A1W2BVU5_9RHOB|nr:hypothetical protein SAMN06295998_10527 [Primorskyibacter flagellatus]
MRENVTVGRGLTKNAFHVHGSGASAQAILRK